MRWMKWTGVAAAILLIGSCFTPWVIIESKDIVISGIDTTGTNFGKPGYFHLLMAAIFLFLTYTARLWAMRCNLFIAAVNLGWAIRNYFIISQCRGGDCPLKLTGIYLMLIASVVIMIAALFPDMKLVGQKRNERR
jgi:hypothetical protein